eukprot:2016603-Lingulodinium_polyedra.AAC.1
MLAPSLLFALRQRQHPRGAARADEGGRGHLRAPPVPFGGSGTRSRSFRQYPPVPVGESGVARFA